MKKQVNPTSKVSTKDQTPNILLIIADDLGKDVVYITGSGTSRAMTVHTRHDATYIYGALPNISRLLRNGLYFSQAWAQPACSTTRASIFTGWHPWKNGVGSPPGELVYKPGLKTLPQLLPSNYVSGLFGKWHLGSLEVDGTLPTDHGWHRFVGTLEGVLTEGLNNGYEDWYIVDSDDKGYDSDPDYEGFHTEDYATWRTVNEAASWINAQSSPWFATIAFHSPHDPFHIPPDGFDTATVGEPSEDEDPSDDYMFNLMAQNMDYNIGRLLGTSGIVGGPLYFDSIQEDQLKNTIILFIGDNGSAKAVALEEEKEHIYEGSLWVPMIIADGQAVVNEFNGQANTPRYLYASQLNATCELLAHVVDLYKTIVRLVDPSANAFPENTDSVDFSDVLTKRFFTVDARTGQKRIYNFSQYYKGDTKKGATIRNSSYKLNYDVSHPLTVLGYTLYKYSGGEIPGQEDVAEPAPGAAHNVFGGAVSGLNAEAQTNLNLLYDELIRNYQPDDNEKSTFPNFLKKKWVI